MERLNYLVKGRFGQLIDVSLEKCKFIDDPLQYINDGADDMIICAYNNEKKEWQKLLNYQVPRTYSMLPRPQNKAMELDYFTRAACLIKHQIIWATKEISKDSFGKLASATNQAEKYKYTVAPWLPGMKNVCKKSMYGFVENDNNNNDSFFPL